MQEIQVCDLWHLIAWHSCRYTLISPASSPRKSGNAISCLFMDDALVLLVCWGDSLLHALSSNPLRTSLYLLAMTKLNEPNLRDLPRSFASALDCMPPALLCNRPCLGDPEALVVPNVRMFNCTKDRFGRRAF